MEGLRIVSLVPSVSHTLVEWGLRSHLVGCTKYCIEPRDLRRTAEVLGGTKDFDVEKLLALRPSHVIFNKEENTRVLVEQIIKLVPSLITFPKDPHGVEQMFREMGDFLGCSEQGNVHANLLMELIGKILQMRDSLSNKSLTFLYLIWRAPYMAAGPDTYISALLELGGWKNVLTSQDRYPILTEEDLAKLSPDIVLLSSEPYPFRRRHSPELRRQLPHNALIAWVDGRLLSWHGMKTIEALKVMVNGGPKMYLRHIEGG